jgi:hypothetical protein
MMQGENNHLDHSVPLLRQNLACLFAALLLASGLAAAATPDVVIFDVPASKADKRRVYSFVVLKAVLERTVAEFGPYRIEHAPAHMERPRMLAALKAGKLVNVTAFPADAEWLKELRFVPIPIDMGLQSWRLLLIDTKNQARLRKVASAGRLNLLKAGAGSAWVSAAVLRDNGYAVVPGGNYLGLFDMLMADRFDYFPRGLNEIFDEYDTHRNNHPALAVDDSVLLHDNIPSFFFVSPQAARLQRRLNAGMEMLLKDGALERLLLASFKNDLLRAKMCTRKLIELPNRALSPALIARRDVWFDPFDPRHGLCIAAQANLAAN